MLINKLWVLVLLLGLATGVSGNVNNCMTCHAEFEDDSGPSHKITRDIHFEKGLGCVDCHGGDATLEDMDDVRQVKGYQGVPTHTEVPQFCARCHSDGAYMRQHNPGLPTDQLDKYKTSVHGQRLYGKKDNKVANCVSCHSVHEIGNAKMPHSSTHPLNLPFTCGHCHADVEYMKEYKISTSQLDDFRASVHGKALLVNGELGAPACNDCHGNHGAAPPGVNSLSAVCGTCHAIESDLFDQSPHKMAFEENDFPMCETCHSNHRIKKPTDAMVGTHEPAVCVECHSSGDGTKGFITADGMSAAIKNLLSAHEEAKVVLDDAKIKGMMTTDAEFLMKDADQAIIKTRTMVHSFNLDSLAPKAQEGVDKANQVKVVSAGLVEEYFFRRKGLGLATLFITLLAVALWFKIKKVESNS